MEFLNKKSNIFINKANLIHKNRYDYSLVDYVNQNTKIKIICLKHGVFEQEPRNHLKGQNCKVCCNEEQSNTKDFFINKANIIHDNRYDYSLVNYINNKTKVKIICPEHGEFEQTPSHHLKGNHCILCSINKQRKTNSNFINESKQINGDKFDYSSVNYINNETKVKIICPEHGEFEQTPNNHITKKQNCPKCSLKYNKCENEVKDFVKSLNISFIGNSRKIIPPFELDIYIPSNKVAIEFDGLYWHSELYLSNNYHFNKTELCEKNDIQLIHIFEDEWLNKKDIVKSRLKNILGKTPNKIYGRKCHIKEVSSKECKAFLFDNHIQGSVNSKVRLGLYYNDELVSLMTFGNLRKSMGSKATEGSYELLRFCNKLDTTVIGGADKLLKYFSKTYKPNEIISYADRRWSQGDLYEKLGFNFIHNSKPNYFYVINNKREGRFNYRKNILVEQGYDSAKTERQIMLDRNIYRIYDSGNKKYIKIN